MGDLLGDVKYAVRMVVRTPILSAVSILTIALGVGLTTHTFSVVYGSVIRGIDVRDAERFVVVHETIPERGVDGMWIPMHDLAAFREQAASFEELAGSYDGTVNVVFDDGPPQRFDGAFVTANGLSVLGVEPHLGRVFEQGEDSPTAAGTMVLGYDIWRNYFGGDASVLGHSYRVNGESMTVIGVMPPKFRFPFDQEIWLPYRVDWAAEPRRTGSSFSVYGHLREDVTLEAAVAEVQGIAAGLAAEFPDDNEGISATVIPFEDEYMPPEITLILYLMLGAVFGVLVIACVNVANLLLARATLRSREVAVRTALGASRFRVVRQLLMEAMVLGSIGGALGLVFSYVGLVAFNAAVIDIQKPYWIDMRMDVPTLIFSIGVTFFAAVLAGTIPALRATGRKLGSVLHDEGRGSSSLRLGRMTGSLVVVELALSCMLLVGAGFMIKSVINAQRVDLGFETNNMMTARVGLFETEYPTRQARQQFFQRLVDNLSAEPGVQSAALTTVLPSTGGCCWLFGFEGESYETDNDFPRAAGSQVSPNYFDTMGVEMIAGRPFRLGESWWSEESGEMAEPVVVVNQSFVDSFLPERDPLGVRMRIGVADSENPWMRIVGVVPDLFVGGGVGGIGNDEQPTERFYMTMGLFDVRFASMAIRTEGPPEPIGQRAREVVAGMDPDLPIYWVRTMDDLLADSTWAFNLFGSLFTTFAVAALFLAAVGLYGVVSFSVTQRRREVGVRMALGAEAGDILRIIFRRVFWQLGIGLTVGLGLGYGMVNPMRAVMFGVETSDMTVYLAIVATLVASALLATFVPARRAMRVDPIAALRSD